MTKRQFGSFALGAACTVLATVSVSRPASADIIPLLFNVSSGSPATGYTWTYNADVTVNQRIDAGDYFTIYDFNGYIAGSEANPLGWTFSASPVGPVPPLVAPVDNPGIVNLTWTWTGGTQTGPLDLGFFSAKSTYNSINEGYFAAYATRSNGPLKGTKIANVGSVSTPGVPEPGTLPLIGSALLGGIAILRRRKIAR